MTSQTGNDVTNLFSIHIPFTVQYMFVYRQPFTSYSLCFFQWPMMADYRLGPPVAFQTWNDFVVWYRWPYSFLSMFHRYSPSSFSVLAGCRFPPLRDLCMKTLKSAAGIFRLSRTSQVSVSHRSIVLCAVAFTFLFACHDCHLHDFVCERLPPHIRPVGHRK